MSLVPFPDLKGGGQYINKQRSNTLQTQYTNELLESALQNLTRGGGRDMHLSLVIRLVEYRQNKQFLALQSVQFCVLMSANTQDVTFGGQRF